MTNVSWDDTLEARITVLQSAAERAGIDLNAERAREVIEGSWQEHVQAWRRGEIFGLTGAAGWCLDNLGMPGDQRSVQVLAEALEGVTTSEGTRLVEGAAEVVDAIRREGIRTALICDTGFTPGRVVKRLLVEHGITLDHYFFSDEVGSPKPYPAIFKAALEATGADPAKSIHIGDLRRTDVAGARAAGMATIRFTGMHDDGWEPEESQGEEADAVLGSWSEAVRLLGLERPED